MKKNKLIGSSIFMVAAILAVLARPLDFFKNA